MQSTARNPNVGPAGRSDATVAAWPAPPKVEHPVSVSVQVPPERPDYTGDLLSGGIGVFGALLGAFVAYWFGSRDARKARERDDRERDAFTSFAVIHKLQKVYAAQDSIYRHIETATSAFTPGPNQHVSMLVSAFANTPERVTLSADEIYRVGRIAGKDVLNALMLLDGQHNTTMDLIDAYRLAKIDFRMATSNKGPAQSGPDGVATYAWTKAEYVKLHPILFQLDQMVAAIRENTRTDRKAALDAIVSIIQARAKRFEDSSEYEVRGLDGALLIITADGARRVEDKP